MNLPTILLVVLLVLGAVAAAMLAAAYVLRRREERRVAGLPAPGPELETDIGGLLIDGSKIKAIRLYRHRTGAGLTEAKEAVEEIGRRRGL